MCLFGVGWGTTTEQLLVQIQNYSPESLVFTIRCFEEAWIEDIKGKLFLCQTVFTFGIDASAFYVLSGEVLVLFKSHLVDFPGGSLVVRSPGGLPSMGLHRVGQDWRNLAAAAAADEGTHVPSLVWGDSTCCQSTKPIHHNYRAHDLEPSLCNEKPPPGKSWNCN